MVSCVEPIQMHDSHERREVERGEWKGPCLIQVRAKSEEHLKDDHSFDFFNRLQSSNILYLIFCIINLRGQILDHCLIGFGGQTLFGLLDSKHRKKKA